MTDEKYVYITDCSEKKHIARSSRNRRTHNGKRGAVKFPSDYLTKKERDAMNGEVKSYKLNDPMTWEEFKKLPDDLKTAYVTALKNKFGVPSNELAEMFGCKVNTMLEFFRTHKLGLNPGKGRGPKSRSFNRKDWDCWLYNACEAQVTMSEEDEVEENVCEEVKVPCENHNEDDTCGRVQAPEVTTLPYIPLKPVDEDELRELMEEFKPLAPTQGNMVFEGPADKAVEAIRKLLGNNEVCLHVSWETMESKKNLTSSKYDFNPIPVRYR